MKPIALLAPCLLIVVFVSGVLVGREFPRHHFVKVPNGPYMFDQTTGKVCVMLHVGPVNAMTGQDNNTYGQIIVSFSLNCSVGNMEGVVGLSFSPDGSQIVAGTLSDANNYAFDLSIYKLDGTLVPPIGDRGEERAS